ECRARAPATTTYPLTPGYFMRLRPSGLYRACNAVTTPGPRDLRLAARYASYFRFLPRCWRARGWIGRPSGVVGFVPTLRGSAGAVSESGVASGAAPAAGTVA